MGARIQHSGQDREGLLKDSEEILCAISSIAKDVSTVKTELFNQWIVLREIKEQVEFAVITAEFFGYEQEDFLNLHKTKLIMLNKSPLIVRVTDEGRTAMREMAAQGEWKEAKRKGHLFHAFLTGLEVNAQPKQIMDAFENSTRFESISTISGKLTFSSKSALETGFLFEAKLGSRLEACTPSISGSATPCPRLTP